MGAVTGIKVKDLVREALVFINDGRLASGFTCIAVACAEEVLCGDYLGTSGPACAAWYKFNLVGEVPEWWNKPDHEYRKERIAALRRWAAECGDEVIY